MFTESDLRTALKAVIDPEVMLNIVDMGLVYGIDIAENNDIQVNMTLTTPHCPLGPQIIADVQQTAGAMEGVGNVDVNIVWDPPWSPAMFTDELKDEMRALGMEFDEDIVNQHEPEQEAPPPSAPKPKKRGGILGWIFGR